MTAAKEAEKIAPVSARRLPIGVIVVACVALGAVSSGGGTNVATLAGWVAYERGWVDAQTGQGYRWISVARADGRLGHNVTPRPRAGARRADQSPAWSVNGRLAFVRTLLHSTDLLVAEHGTWQVQRVNRLGPSSDLFEFDAPAWSPDERYIAWPVSGLFVIDVRRRTRLKVGGAACAPRWSPDGQTLLYLVGDCGAESPRHRRVEVVGIDGGARRVLAHGSFNSADWSPDGLRVAYAGDCERGPGGDPWCQVLISNADGSRLRRLSLPSGWLIDWVRWTDASTIVAGGSHQVNGDGPGLLKIDVDRGTTRPLAPGVIHIWPQAPTVTADGSIAIVQSFGPRVGRPALVDADTGAVTWGAVPRGWPGAGAIAVG